MTLPLTVAAVSFGSTLTPLVEDEFDAGPPHAPTTIATTAISVVKRALVFRVCTLAITPSDLKFRIISTHHGIKMYPGQIIEYKVKPLLNIPMYWMTEITHVQEAVFFIDEQRYGPFSLWQHQHHFKQVNGAVEMTDIVHYKIPGWFLGDIVNAIYVKKKLKKMFDYRYRRIEEIFAKKL